MAPNFARSLIRFALVAGLVGGGCANASSPGSANGDRIADFVLAGNTLTEIGEHEAETAALNNNDPSGLRWTFTGTDGVVLDQGEVTDGRTAVSEFAQDGTAAPIKAQPGSMVFTLRLPAAEGTLRVYEGAQTTTSTASSLATGRTVSLQDMGGAEPTGISPLRRLSARADNSEVARARSHRRHHLQPLRPPMSC